jgi:MoaA/NifB/PqqE/SkfB family radical SAM enzyme
MSNIVSVESLTDYFHITWTIQLRCNYDCMYCGPDRHNVNGEITSLDKLQAYWTQIYEKTKHRNKKYNIQINGGEPTVNKNLIPFLQWLTTEYKEQIVYIGVSSNGSASKNYYLNLLKYVSGLVLSTHTEHMDETKFFDTAIACTKHAVYNKKLFEVNIMDEPWAGENIARFVDTCQKFKINYAIYNIDMSRRSRDYPVFKIKSNVATTAQ